jgi:hypothetical protein
MSVSECCAAVLHNAKQTSARIQSLVTDHPIRIPINCSQVPNIFHQTLFMSLVMSFPYKHYSTQTPFSSFIGRLLYAHRDNISKHRPLLYNNISQSLDHLDIPWCIFPSIFPIDCNSPCQTPFNILTLRHPTPSLPCRVLPIAGLSLEATDHSPSSTWLTEPRAVLHSPTHWDCFTDIYHIQGVIFCKITHLICSRRTVHHKTFS